MSENRLMRSETDKILGGVCGGIAAYLNIDSVLIRLAFVVLLFASGIGFPIYIILWLIMPRDDGEIKVGSEVIQKNIEDMSSTVSSSVNRFGRPGTVGLMLILFGAYFLMNQLGWLSGAFWPLVIIGLGVYLLARRSQSGA